VPSPSPHGEITEEEMDAAVRSMRARAIVVRGGRVVDDKVVDDKVVDYKVVDDKATGLA
jgi:hypothetical protein